MKEKDDAQARLKDLPIKPGDRFVHYKTNGVYEVVTLAVKEDTLEPLVVYRNLEKGNVWVRTCKNFTEEVEYGGKRVKRFSPIN